MPIIPRDTFFLTGVQYLLYTPFSALRKREVSWISGFPVITTFQARHGIRTDGIQLIYNNEWDPMEVPWEDKIDKIFWRGATTGGGSRPPGFSPHYQRHRYVFNFLQKFSPLKFGLDSSA